MEIKELTCISCPLGCPITVTVEGNSIIDITGYTCKRGLVYAKREITNPTRVVTSTIPVIGGVKELVSVKTREPIPKNKINDCMEALKSLSVQAPVVIGEAVLDNVADTGIPIVCTQSVLSRH